MLNLILRNLRLIFPALLSAVVMPSARADADDTFNVAINSSVMRDSNLFRQKSGAQQDTMYTNSLTLSLNKKYSLQRISLDATLVDYRFAENDYLNYQAKNYNAGWQWSITPRVHGSLTMDRTEIQNSFVDYSATTPEQLKNVRRNENQRLKVEWDVFGGWTAIAGVVRTTQANSQSFLAQSAFELVSREYGGRYVWPAGTYLQLLRRQGDGDYKERALTTFDVIPYPFNPQIDTRFHQNETELRFFLPLTAKSSFTTRLSHVSREHEHFPARDYAGTAGRIEYSWLPTGKLGLSVALRRDLSPYQDYASSYYTSTGLTIQPSWQVSSKMALRFRHDVEKRIYQGPLIPNLFQERKDTIRSTRASLEWYPARWTTLSASVQKDQRDSSIAQRKYEDNMVTLSAQFNF